MTASLQDFSDEQLLELLETQEKIQQNREKTSQGQSALSRIGRGLFRGVEQFGRMLGPLPQSPQDRLSDILGQERFLDENLPVSNEQPEDLLGQILQTSSKGLERGLEIFPTVATFPGFGAGEAAIRSGLAGASAQGVEELGGGQTAQTFAEIPALIGPNVFKSTITPKNAKQAELLSFGRSQGLTDKELAPLITEPGRSTSALAKLSPKGGKTSQALKNSNEALSKAFGKLNDLPEASQSLKGAASSKFLGEVNEKLINLPSELRSKITPDLSDFLNSERTGKDLINLWQDINFSFNKNKKQLQTLKGPISNALESLSPEFRNNFELTNQLTSNFKNLSKQLQPGKFDGLFNNFRSMRIVGGMLLGNPAVIGEAISEQGAKVLSREMLLNPKFKNIGNKFVTALKNSSPKLLDSAAKQFNQLLNQIDPDFKDAMEDFNSKEILKEFNRNQNQVD